MPGPHEGWAAPRPAHRPMPPYDLGIDLGTTFTAAAVRVEGHPGAPEPGVRVVGLEQGAVQVPSVLLVDDDGSLLVGADAEDRAPGAPQRVVREFKRRLGDDTPIVVGGESFSADGVAAEMVRWTADRVAERHGAGPRRIAVAHPAGWGAYRRRVFTEALAEVGLHDVVLLTEPEAAAAAHAATGRLPLGRTVAVYDLGGGTFDAAVVRGVHPDPVAPVGLTVLGRGQGLEALGGIDFDESLFWHVCSELGGAVDALDPADPATVRAVAGLRRACVAAKETLSVDTAAVVDVRLPNVTTRVRVTRGEFEEMISPALRQTVDVLGEVLDSARVAARDLDGVLLVGGSSRIPLVARMLSAELGRPVAVDPDPTTVVARGATWAAAAASGAVRSTRRRPYEHRDDPYPRRLWPNAKSCQAHLYYTARARRVGPRFRGDEDGGRLSSTFTPAFSSSTRAACFAARAIDGSSRTRSCAIEPSTSSVELGRKAFGIGDAELHQQIAKPEPAAFLEGDRDLLDRLDPPRPSSATALTNGQPRKSLLAKRALQPIEGAEDLLGRRLVGRAAAGLKRRSR